MPGPEQRNGTGPEPLPPSLDPVDPEGEEPDERQFFEIPLTSIVRRDKRGQVAGVLSKLRQGDFQEAAHLAEDILTDDRVYSCLNTRVNGLVGTPMAFRPALATRKARKIAEAFEDTDEQRGLWNRMFPPSEIAELLRWGVLLGVGVAEVIWDTVTERDLWIPRLKVWHPSMLRWQWDYSSPDSGAYWLTTATTDAPNIRIQPGDGRWVLYLPYAQRRAWLRGVLPCLGELFLGRRWTMGTDWPRYNEVHGLPIRLAEVPPDAPQRDKNEFYRSVKNLNNEGTLRVSKGANGGWGLTLVEATADTFNAFKEYLIKAEASISIAILGTDINNVQASGVVAHQKAAEQIRDDYRRMDASTIPQTLYEQVVRWFAHYNFGDADLAPRAEYLVDPPSDGTIRSQELVNLATAFASFKTSGVPIDYAAVLDEHNVPVLAQEDAAEMLPAPAPGEVEGEPAGEAAPEATPDEKELRAVTLAAGRPKSKPYPLRLAENAERYGARALKLDLARVLRIVEQAKDPDDLRKRLRKLYEDAKVPGTFAKLVERALILAEMKGRVDVLGE